MTGIADALAPTSSADPLGLNFRPLPPQQQAGDMFEQAMNEYPILRKAYEQGDLHFKFTPREGHPVPGMETWPPGETGFGPDNWRPPEFPIDKHGVEVYSKDVPSIDILGDAVSHMLFKSDPVLQEAYRNFEASLTPGQIRRLRQQYAGSQRRGEEGRPYELWKEGSGLPAYFRGYLFGQWYFTPAELMQWYTPQQIEMFNEVRKYLGIQPETVPRREEGEL